MTFLPMLQAAASFTKEYAGAWAMHGAGIGALRLQRQLDFHGDAILVISTIIVTHDLPP